MPTTSPHLPFLLISIRAEPEAADDEYQSVLRLGRLEPTELRSVNLTQQPLGSIDLDDWSGFILGGGPYNVSDPADCKTGTQQRVEDELLDFVGRVVEADAPFLGCCYGVGTLGTAIGATVDRQYGEPVGAVSVTLTTDGRDDPLFAYVPETFDAYGGHKEAAATLPATATHLAMSPTCPVQAFRVGKNVYATQFHPELDADSLATRIDVYRDFGYFAPEEADSLKASARERDARYPTEILRRFVELYRRPAA